LLVEGGRGHFDVDGRPVQSHEAFLDQGDVAAFAKPLEPGEHTRTGVGMDELQDRLAHDILIRGRAEELDRRRVGEDDHALLVDHDAVRRDLDEPPAPFLGLAQRVFGPLALGHVPGDPQDADDRAVHDPGSRGELPVDDLAGLRHYPELVGGGAFAGQRSSEQLHGQGKVVGMEEGSERPPQPFVPGPPGDPLEGLVERGEGAVGGKREDDVGGALDQAAVALLRFPERMLGELSIGQLEHAAPARPHRPTSGGGSAEATSPPHQLLVTCVIDAAPAEVEGRLPGGSLLGMATGARPGGEAAEPPPPTDLHALEARLQDVPAALEEFGPHYAVELDPKAHRIEGSGIRDATLGANDGLVSVLTIIAGAAGAATGRTVLLAGIAALIGGAISMGIGAFVSAKAYRAYFLKELQRELREMREMPDIEREEIRDVYRARGFEGESLDMVVTTITSNPKVWLRVMMQEELGLSEGFGQPLGAAFTVALAFLVGGVVPVLPFIAWSGVAALGVSFVLTAVGLLVGGAIRTRFTGENLLRAGAELIAMAAVGVGVAYGVGRVLHAAGVGRG